MRASPGRPRLLPMTGTRCPLQTGARADWPGPRSQTLKHTAKTQEASNAWQKSLQLRLMVEDPAEAAVWESAPEILAEKLPAMPAPWTPSWRPEGTRCFSDHVKKLLFPDESSPAAARFPCR